MADLSTLATELVANQRIGPPRMAQLQKRAAKIRRRRRVAGSVTVLLVILALGTAIRAATQSSRRINVSTRPLATGTPDAPPAGGPASTVSTSQLPANTNPDNTPKIGKSMPNPMTKEEQLRQAKALQAADPNNKILCLHADGSMAGMTILDRIHPELPLTPAQAAAACERMAPGSRPWLGHD